MTEQIRQWAYNSQFSHIPKNANLLGSMSNRLCSDTCSLFMVEQEGRIYFSWWGEGCTLMSASAYILCMTLSGYSWKDITCVVDKTMLFLHTGDTDNTLLFEFLPFYGRNRWACVSMVWQVIKEFLSGQ